jgi:hypothetical protein
MSRPLTANSRNEAEMMSKAKRQQTMAQDPLGMYSLSRFPVLYLQPDFLKQNYSSSLIQSSFILCVLCVFLIFAFFPMNRKAALSIAGSRSHRNYWIWQVILKEIFIVFHLSSLKYLSLSPRK